MVEFVLPLSRLRKKDVDKAGGKAANLGELLKFNFPVPEGFVILTYAYSIFTEKNGLNETIPSLLSQIDYSQPDLIAKISQTIQESIREAAIPPEIIMQIGNYYRKLQYHNVAVRSSATAEDLPTASFAGQQETFLNIKGIDDVIHYVRECYASLWTSRAIIYRKENNISHKNVLIAVIVQVMISAISAGVLFTVSPISSDRNVSLVEATFGLGESLVSGSTTPDQFTVSRKKGFKIISRKISQKTIITKESEQGIKQIELPEEESKKSSLTDEQIINLTKIGKDIESKLKKPQDVEWAINKEGKIQILQSRPITSLTSLPRETDTVWSRGWSDDYWNDPTTPLFFDLLGSQLTWVASIELNRVMGYPSSEQKFLKLAYGHVYFSLNAIKSRVETEIPPFLRNEEFLNYFPEGEGPYGKVTVKGFPFRLLKRIVAEIRVMMHDGDNGSILKTANSYESWSQNIFNPFCQEFDSRLDIIRKNGSLRELLDLSTELEGVMIDHYRMVRYGITVHCLGMNLMVQYLLSRFLEKNLATQVYPALISGLKHKATEINGEIHKLASIIQKNSNLRNLVLETSSNELFDKISKEKEDKSIQDFLTEFNRFLSNYGDRGFSREVYYPRWGEAPQYVFDLLKSLVSDQHKDLTNIVTKTSVLRKKTEKFVEAKIRKTRFGLVKYKLYSQILGFARRYIIFREDQRFNLDRWITRNRKLYLEIGKRFTQQNILRKPSEIFFLNKNEIRKLTLHQFTDEKLQKFSVLLKKRIDVFKKYEYVTPSKFLQGSLAFNDPIEELTDMTLFRGNAASQGVITGKVRVLTDISGISQVRTGDILVVPKTDPGWTPVFSKIGGLITETGGILSHGAVVSREYSIPAVTNIVNACNIFKDNMIVTLDGNTGTVKIIN
ncbi:MAG: PEP/pyruvate-binding domain-containing protein [Candidatus Hodarchaeota archaeon]